MVQLPKLLYLLAEQIDGRRGYDEIAARFSEAAQRDVGPDDARMLVEEKLRPLGILQNADGSSPQIEKVDPLLALKFRAALVPKGVTRALTTIFYPLFHPLAIALVLGALVAVDIWFFFFHGVAQPLRELAYNPILLLMVLGLVVIATVLHEIGHATAARYGGAEPGVMGAGIYIVWPAFYTDVTDAYRLDRAGRLRTDLGGVYFNCVFVLAITAAYAVTRFEPLLVLIIVQHMQILQQFLPFLRLDGYYILSDLTGVPDMFARIKPTLRSAVPGRENEPEVDALKPWVRRVTLAWVLFLIPVLLFVFGMLVFNAPRMIATAWDSLGVQLDRIGEGGTLNVLGGTVQALALVLPLAGATYTVTRVVGRVGDGAWSWSAGAPLRRALVVASSAAIAGISAYVLLPNGEYKPIQPGERGTVLAGVRQLSAVPTGRPALTEERESELGGAPTVRSGKAPLPAEQDEEQPAGGSAGTGGSGGEAPQDGQQTTTGSATTTQARTSPTATQPAQTTATQTTATQTTSTAPAQTTPAQTAPAQTTPAQTTPAQTTPTTTEGTETTAP